jgi:hypothetical protein
MLKRFCSVCLLASLAAAACGPRPLRTTPTTGSLPEARKFLEGRWSLESFELFPPGGAPIRLPGSGTLEYDDFSNLKMDVRTDAATAATLQKLGIVLRDGVISSSGRTMIDLPNKTLTYVMEGQPAGPDATGPLGLSFPRHWLIEGNLLTLTTLDANGKPLSVSRWRKQSK